MTKKRIIVTVLSDTHSGSVLGLCNPETELENDVGDKIRPELSEGQQYLYNDVYLPAIEQVKTLSGKDEIVLLHLGDVTQGNRFAQELMANDSIANQTLIAEGIFSPWLNIKNLKTIRLVKGTGVHTFGNGSSEILIAHLLQRNSKIDVRVSMHGLLHLYGCVIDYAHHGPSTGIYQWTRGNIARSYLRNLMLGEILSDRQPPNIVLRGHYHSMIKEFFQLNNYESWMVVCPSLCLLSEYAVKISRSSYELSNGLIALEILDGQLYKIHSFTQKLDLRMEEFIDNQTDKSTSHIAKYDMEK